VATYAALLRAVNLGARNRVAMADLRALVEGLGGKDVRTYMQSGNVVFRHRSGVAGLVTALEQAIELEFGLEITVVVRSAAQLASVVQARPFDPTGLYVSFLASAPKRAAVRELVEADHGPDRIAAKGKEVYLHLPGGYGQSRLNNAFLERRLGVRATLRNWRTVTAVTKLAARSSTRNV
jgi:uncharacterized protein (DUF1697 family)